MQTTTYFEDIQKIERRAHALRAEAMRHGFSVMKSWIGGMFKHRSGDHQPA